MTAKPMARLCLTVFWCGRMGRMEHHPTNLEQVINLLHKWAVETEISLVIEAQIAISPDGVALLDFQPNPRLETIPY